MWSTKARHWREDKQRAGAGVCLWVGVGGGGYLERMKECSHVKAPTQ